MNYVEKGKVALILFGVALFVLCAICEVVGIVLLTNYTVTNLIFGIILIIVGVFLLLLGIYFVWVGASQKATKGSIKEQNDIAKNTVNAKLCSKCGNEVPTGAEYCPKCGQTSSSCKVCECGAENNIENTKCTSCGKDI